MYFHENRVFSSLSSKQLLYALYDYVALHIDRCIVTHVELSTYIYRTLQWFNQ